MDATPRGHCQRPRSRRGARGPAACEARPGAPPRPATRRLVLRSHLQNQLPPEPSAALMHSWHRLASREAPGRCPSEPARRILVIGGHPGCGSPSAGVHDLLGPHLPPGLPLARCELVKHWAFPWAAVPGSTVPQGLSAPNAISLGCRQAPGACGSLAPQESGHSPVATGPAGPHGLWSERLVPWRKKTHAERDACIKMEAGLGTDGMTPIFCGRVQTSIYFLHNPPGEFSPQSDHSKRPAAGGPSRSGGLCRQAGTPQRISGQDSQPLPPSTPHRAHHHRGALWKRRETGERTWMVGQPGRWAGSRQGGA